VNRTSFALFVVLLLAGAMFASAPEAAAQTPQTEPAPPSDIAPVTGVVEVPMAQAPPALLYHPITRRQRLNWFVDSTVGPETLAVGLFSAGIGTARDAPKEYGGTWDGFAKRYGMRLTGVSTGNAMEVTLGSLWGEDPRYFRARQEPFGGRVRNVVLMTFLAHNRTGHYVPAYARYIATPGNNFLSNSWRPDSEATTQGAIVRAMWGFVGLMGKNAFTEFWPDAKGLMFHRKD
jgi:hypothetical protein